MPRAPGHSYVKVGPLEATAPREVPLEVALPATPPMLPEILPPPAH